ncbi:SIMPL domain-containing protein [Massilia aerilata]|uniref:SIMPL domain-containing protein n=1 Tax=Massilia aerilata TaxID=453817 RepID=A0ABW0RZ66_9BURK
MLKLKPLLPILVAGFLAAAVLALPAAPAAASTIPDYPFVHVIGNSFRVEMPDIAALDFQIIAADADPAAARAVIEARVAEVRALMQELSVDPEDMVVSDVRQGVRKERAPDGAALYELSAAVKINVRNVANWPRLAGGVLGKPNVDSFAADFDLSTMDKVNDELVTEAVMDARRRAEVMAAASGRRLGPAMAMTTDALKKLGTRLGLEREEFKAPRGGRRTGNQRADEIDRDTFLAVQALKLGQSVDVVYRLENAAPAKLRPAHKP